MPVLSATPAVVITPGVNLLCVMLKAVGKLWQAVPLPPVGLVRVVVAVAAVINPIRKGGIQPWNLPN